MEVLNLGYHSSKTDKKNPNHQQKRTLSVNLEFFGRQTIGIGKRRFLKASCSDRCRIDGVLWPQYSFLGRCQIDRKAIAK